ncbi:MAG TPA: alpha/beta fold hydrolase [Kofleriaceae bacterium]|jgi:homoserine O-acetyltransferase|nr:alpha/beta fold hydrolase [Kofleriaceae bacterium]
MKPAALALLVWLAACQDTRDLPVPHAPEAPRREAPRPAAPAAPPRPGPQPIAGVTPVTGDYTIRDFAFTSGEKLPEVRLHYVTFGTAKRDAAGHVTNAVVILHGTTGSGTQFLRKQFTEPLFGPGQALDLTRYFVIIPDGIGHGGSTRPSDGLHARFPHYGYVDLVESTHKLLVDGLHVDHLRLVMGTSMGCMHAFMWAEQWPAMMDAAMGLACLPDAITGRNRVWRKMLIDAIEHDPQWNHGEYTEQPRAALLGAGQIFALANTAPLADQKRLATREAADKEVEDGEHAFAATYDANDLLYAFKASFDYDAAPGLEKITVPFLLVNSADDFINPPELGIAEREMKRVKRGRFVLLPATDTTHGHGMHSWASYWQGDLRKLLDSTARK